MLPQRHLSRLHVLPGRFSLAARGYATPAQKGPEKRPTWVTDEPTPEPTPERSWGLKVRSIFNFTVIPGKSNNTKTRQRLMPARNIYLPDLLRRLRA
jgi:hypothetical protein